MYLQLPEGKAAGALLPRATIAALHFFLAPCLPAPARGARVFPLHHSHFIPSFGSVHVSIASALSVSSALLPACVGAGAVNWPGLTKTWDPGESSANALPPTFWELSMEICCFSTSFPQLTPLDFPDCSGAPCCWSGLLEEEVQGELGSDPAAALIIEDPIEMRSSCRGSQRASVTRTSWGMPGRRPKNILKELNLLF